MKMALWGSNLFVYCSVWDETGTACGDYYCNCLLLVVGGQCYEGKLMAIGCGKACVLVLCLCYDGGDDGTCFCPVGAMTFVQTSAIDQMTCSTEYRDRLYLEFLATMNFVCYSCKRFVLTVLHFSVQLIGRLGST